MFVTRGVAYMVNNNRNTDAIATGIGKEAGDKFQNFFYYGKTLGVYNTFWIALVIFLIFFFLLSKTRTGRHIYAIGSNVDAARNVKLVIGRTLPSYRFRLMIRVIMPTAMPCSSSSRVTAKLTSSFLPGILES